MAGENLIHVLARVFCILPGLPLPPLPLLLSPSVSRASSLHLYCRQTYLDLTTDTEAPASCLLASPPRTKTWTRPRTQSNTTLPFSPGPHLKPIEGPRHFKDRPPPAIAPTTIASRPPFRPPLWPASFSCHFSTGPRDRRTAETTRDLQTPTPPARAP